MKRDAVLKRNRQLQPFATTRPGSSTHIQEPGSTKVCLRIDWPLAVDYAKMIGLPELWAPVSSRSVLNSAVPHSPCSNGGSRRAGIPIPRRDELHWGPNCTKEVSRSSDKCRAGKTYWMAAPVSDFILVCSKICGVVQLNAHERSTSSTHRDIVLLPERSGGGQSSNASAHYNDIERHVDES